MQAADQLDAMFLALSDQTRRAILLRLAEGEATVNELAEPFDLKRPTISKHLKVLEQAGLIETRRESQFRKKTLKTSNLQTAAEWMRLCASIWETRFEGLDAYVAELEKKDSSNDK